MWGGSTCGDFDQTGFALSGPLNTVIDDKRPVRIMPPELGAELGLIGGRTNWVLANLPPAAVWRYRRSPSAPSLSCVA